LWPSRMRARSACMVAVSLVIAASPVMSEM
jgi:hypothetical protein